MSSGMLGSQHTCTPKLMSTTACAHPDYARRMSKDSARCIYCPVMFDPSKGEGDHVVPRGFGDFEGAIIFRGVCPNCNNKISVLEEELLRTAPEAVLRRLAGATQNRRGKPAGWQGASGLPAPRFVTQTSLLPGLLAILAWHACGEAAFKVCLIRSATRDSEPCQKCE